MKRLFFISALAASSLAFQACNRDHTSETNESLYTSMTTPSTDLEETSFAEKAASGGMMEVKLGEMAQENASSIKVKEFGMMMVKDHSKANDELMAIANKMKVTLPKEMMPKQEQMVADLKSKKGAEFDKAYMDMMVNDHKEDIALYEKEAQSSTDVMLKDFAAKTLPVLKMHLNTATSTQSEVK
jgi:putative membrane protein